MWVVTDLGKIINLHHVFAIEVVTCSAYSGEIHQIVAFNNRKEQIAVLYSHTNSDAVYNQFDEIWSEIAKVCRVVDLMDV